MQTPAAATDRPSLYANIHKALRSLMTDTLGQVDLLLDIFANHVKHENEFMRTALEARKPAGRRGAHQRRPSRALRNTVRSSAPLSQTSADWHTALAESAAETAHQQGELQ